MRVLSSSQYKYTIFFAKIQIPLTFRNTYANVKMRRFAAASLWRVLYYEGHTGKWHPSARKGAQRVEISLDFVIDPKCIESKFIELTLNDTPT